jgi:IMP cyclohydrolase
MYVGRIVSVGCSKSGQVSGLYRVSSRSFPNREAKVLDGTVAILPKAGFEDDIHRNPYIAYNCLIQAGNRLVVSNGSHTDIIANKLNDGMSMRDALVAVLHNMDFEHDDYDTPRIAGIIDSESRAAALGSVSKNSLYVEQRDLNDGEAFYVATYEHTKPGSDYRDAAFDISNASDACDYIIGKGVFADLERPITAACAVATGAGTFDIAIADAPAPN